MPDENQRSLAVEREVHGVRLEVRAVWRQWLKVPESVFALAGLQRLPDLLAFRAHWEPLWVTAWYPDLAA